MASLCRQSGRKQNRLRASAELPPSPQRICVLVSCCHISSALRACHANIQILDAGKLCQRCGWRKWLTLWTTCTPARMRSAWCAIRRVRAYRPQRGSSPSRHAKKHTQALHVTPATHTRTEMPMCYPFNLFAVCLLPVRTRLLVALLFFSPSPVLLRLSQLSHLFAQSSSAARLSLIRYLVALLAMGGAWPSCLLSPSTSQADFLFCVGCARLFLMSAYPLTIERFTFRHVRV